MWPEQTWTVTRLSECVFVVSVSCLAVCVSFALFTVALLNNSPVTSYVGYIEGDTDSLYSVQCSKMRQQPGNVWPKMLMYCHTLKKKMTLRLFVKFKQKSQLPPLNKNTIFKTGMLFFLNLQVFQRFCLMTCIDVKTVAFTTSFLIFSTCTLKVTIKSTEWRERT